MTSARKHPPLSDDYAEIGNLIRSTRRRQGLSQPDLAKQFGISRHFVMRMEMGCKDYTNPCTSTADRLMYEKVRLWAYMNRTKRPKRHYRNGNLVTRIVPYKKRDQTWRIERKAFLKKLKMDIKKDDKENPKLLSILHRGGHTRYHTKELKMVMAAYELGKEVVLKRLALIHMTKIAALGAEKAEEMKRMENENGSTVEGNSQSL